MLIRLRSNLISYVIMLFCAVCSFGMAMNTLLATVYIPNFYELMQKLQEKFSRKKNDDVKKNTDM